MNVPAIVKKTFDELRNQQEYIEIVNYVVNSLRKLNTAIQRAQLAHEIVDKYNEEVFSHPLVQQLSPCQIGCTACCHTQVSVTEDEARLLMKRIHEGVSVDEDLLKSQMATKNDGKAFYEIPYSQRRCIFLDEKGACRVYEDRPSVCRTNAVLGRPDQCDTSESIQPVRLVKTPKADMAIYGSYLSSKSSGSLPYMLGELLGLSAEVEEVND